MADSATFTFRPRKELEGDFQGILEWCERHQIAISAIFNSYLPAINYAINNTLYEFEGDLYARSDFGDIKICKRTEHTPQST